MAYGQQAVGRDNSGLGLASHIFHTIVHSGTAATPRHTASRKPEERGHGARHDAQCTMHPLRCIVLHALSLLSIDLRSRL
jgi:hypothetical protein